MNTTSRLTSKVIKALKQMHNEYNNNKINKIKFLQNVLMRKIKLLTIEKAQGINKQVKMEYIISVKTIILILKII